VEVTDSDKTHSLTSCIKICSCEKFYGQDKLENVREKIFLFGVQNVQEHKLKNILDKFIKLDYFVTMHILQGIHP
jgi:hypothetical protein